MSESPSGAAFPSCALIAGQGRSGTNWLLHIFDASERTHCRNEPDRIEGAGLSMLPKGWIPPPDDQAFGPQWDRAVEGVCRTVGQTDHPPRVPKLFIRSWALRTGIYERLLLSPRLRRSLSVLEPRFSRHPWEFEIPRWLGHSRALSRTLTVIKLCQVPGWICWVLKHRPDIPVFHIVRHPGGFLNSWTNRWLLKNDEAAVADANRRRLKILKSVRPDWADRFGEIDTLSVQESELWFWRYATETIHDAGRSSDRYRLVIYEDLAARTEEFMVDIYRSCGLPVTDQVYQRVSQLTTNTDSIAGAWRHKLDRHGHECVERILEQQPMKDWWD